MALPPLEPDHDVVTHRLESFDDLGDVQVDKGFCYVSCDSCGFTGWDRTFIAWPDNAYESPSALVTFVEGQGRSERVRKCPDCHEDARLEGLRVFVAAGSLDRELIAEHDARRGRTDFFLMDESGVLDGEPPDGEALRSACLDSCLRAGSFIEEVTPARRAEATELFALVAKNRPGQPQPHLALARMAFEAGDEGEALRHAGRAEDCADDDAEAASELARLFGDLAVNASDGAHLDAAVRWYTRAMTLSPDDRRLNLAIARLLIQIGSFADATKHLERAAAYPSTTLEARYLQGVMAVHQGRPQVAAQLLSELSEDVPGDASVLHMLAWAAAQCGDREGAEEALAQAARLPGGREDQAYFAGLVAETLQEAREEPAG